MSDGHKKGQCLEDYLRGFGHEKVWTKLIRRLLKDDLKEDHTQVCQEIIERLVNKTDLFRRVIMGNEIWIFETNHQSNYWKSPTSPRPNKAKQSKLKVSHVDHVLRWKRYRPQRVLVAGTDDQSVSIQGDHAAKKEESCAMTNRGCFTTTMHLLTTPWVSSSSRPRGTSPHWNYPPIYFILLHVAFFFSSSSRGFGLKTWRLVMTELEGIPEEFFQQ